MRHLEKRKKKNNHKWKPFIYIFLSQWTLRTSVGSRTVTTLECYGHKVQERKAGRGRGRTGFLLQHSREREMFYLTTHSTHFIYGNMALDIWLRTIPIVRKETRCRHIGYSYRLTARVLLSHRQYDTYHGLCYTSRGALTGTRNSSMGPPHEGSIRRPIAPWANALPLSYVLLPAATTFMLKKHYRPVW